MIVFYVYREIVFMKYRAVILFMKKQMYEAVYYLVNLIPNQDLVKYGESSGIQISDGRI